MEEFFKPYEIIGKYPGEISEEFAFAVGRAAVLLFSGNDIVVGRDCRLGSDKLAEALMKGIVAQGGTVANIGLCSMPMIYFAAQNNPAIMVTSSHISKEYNGFTFCEKGGRVLGSPNGLTIIKDLIEGKLPKHTKKGHIKKRDIMSKYVAHVRKFKGKLKKLKVVVDAGNGMAGYIVPKVFQRLVNVIPLSFKLDGNFPSRHPNPLTPSALSELSKAVKKHKANLGVAYDADCDKVVFVDERGILVRPDLTLAVLAQHSLKEHIYGKVLYDVRCSRIVREKVTESGGVPIMMRTGPAYARASMRDEYAVLGGELSGHYYFRENFYADSGDVALMLMLSAISEERQPLSKLVHSLQKYSYSGELNFVVADHEQKLKKAEKEYGDNGEVYHIDGLSIEFPDWWFNLRSINNKMTLVVEAKTKALLDRKVAELKRLLA